MDLEDADKKVNQLDKLLTDVTIVLKKHWILISILLFACFVYSVWTDDSIVIEEDNIEIVDSVTIEENIIEEDKTVAEKVIVREIIQETNE